AVELRVLGLAPLPRRQGPDNPGDDGRRARRARLQPDGERERGAGVDAVAERVLVETQGVREADRPRCEERMLRADDGQKEDRGNVPMSGHAVDDGNLLEPDESS